MSLEKRDNGEFQSAAKTKFLTEFDKYNGKNYNSIILPLRQKPIKPKAKSMLTDELFDKEKAFESMTCNHITYNKLKHKNCTRCKFNEREIWLETTLNELTGNEETQVKDKDGLPLPNQPLKKITVDRGSLDDVRGIIWEWG